MAAVSERNCCLEVLDVRPVIAKGEHPLAEVMTIAQALEPNGVLELIAPFEPRPLMARLRDAGCEVTSQHQPDGTWLVRAGKDHLAPLEELTLLPAPEPLERVLEASARLLPGAVFTAHLPRNPALLTPHLEARGLRWKVAERPDGTAVVWVKR